MNKQMHIDLMFKSKHISVDTRYNNNFIIELNRKK